MLDENLPTFYIKPSNEKPTHQATVYLAKGADEAQPSYSLRHLDPAAPGSRNKYAVALSDSYVPDVLYAEALLIPKWTQPNLSQDAARANGGVPPPPEPILPSEFTIQLYNPDQQVIVRHKPGSWNTSMSWEFGMPQQTFRQPSGSALDRTMSDPAASDVTPKLSFTWRKEGRLSKDLGCYLSGKTTNPDGSNRRNREADITVAIFKALKEITLYEPNLYRVEMEDFKGLEVVVMLGAIIIRDVYFGNIKETFHVSGPPKTPNLVEQSVAPVNGQHGQQPKASGKQPACQAIQGQSGRARQQQQQQQPPPPPAQQQQQQPQQLHQQQKQQKQQQQPPQGTKPPPNHQPQPLPTDPRTQWEINEESRRLKQQSEAEVRERRRREKDSEKQAKRMLEAEKKEAQRRQAHLNKETERLRKLYGKEDDEYRKRETRKPQQPAPQPQPPPRPQSHPQPQHQQQQHQPHHRHPFSLPRLSPNIPPRQPAQTPIPHGRHASGPVPVIQGPNSQRPPPAAHPTMNGPHLRPPPSGPAPAQQPQLRDRRSIMSLFKREEDPSKTVTKKQSSLF